MHTAVLELVTIAAAKPNEPTQFAGALVEKYPPFTIKDVVDAVTESTNAPGPVKMTISWPSHFSIAEPRETVTESV